MPVKKKEFELNNGTKIWVRQASGLEKLKLNNKQSSVFKRFSAKGSPDEWTTDEQIDFAEALDEKGAGIEAQLELWLPACILDVDFDTNLFTLEEMMPILSFIRGDEEDGAVDFLTS